MSHEIMTPTEPMMNNARMASMPVSPSGEASPFSEGERKMFRDDDYAVAKMVVGIMGSVFTGGLALYIFIACLVALGGH